MMITDQDIEKIAEAYTAAGATWVKIEDIAKATGMSGEQIGTAIRALMADDGFRAEPQPFNHRITEWDKANAPVIGGEARHLISWE